MKAKKVISCLMAGAMVLSMAACGSGDATNDASSSRQESVQESSKEGTDSTVEESQSSSNEMTLDELVAAAQEEASAADAGTFMVYAPTSRIEKALKAFSEEYGIQGEYYNESGQDLYTKLTTELEAGVKDTADVALFQDSYLFQTQLQNYDYIENYIPPYLSDVINADDQNPLVCYYYNKLFIFNNTNGMEGISNVWALTDPANEGKTFMKDISKESVNKNFLAMLTKDEWADKLATAYKDYFGTDIVLDDDCQNAGYQFIKNFLANVTFGSGDGDIATELANGNGGNVGLFVYSKLRDDSVTQENLTVAAYQDAQPEGFSGFMYPMYLQMIKGTDRPYTSQLFIYFLMTEKGFKSAFQTKESDIGTYSANSTISSLDGDRELAFWKDCLVSEDPQYLQEAYAAGILDFITYCTNK